MLAAESPKRSAKSGAEPHRQRWTTPLTTGARRLPQGAAAQLDHQLVEALEAHLRRAEHRALGVVAVGVGHACSDAGEQLDALFHGRDHVDVEAARGDGLDHVASKHEGVLVHHRDEHALAAGDPLRRADVEEGFDLLVQAADGVKVSLLSAEHETACARLPEGVRLYTGDDFNYPELIEGDGEHHSDALLGAFAAIAPAASAALTALDEGDVATYRAEMAPTLRAVPAHLRAPTFYYKTGIAFLAWLSGHQDGFTMVGGLQAARSPVHLARVFELANAARLLPDPNWPPPARARPRPRRESRDERCRRGCPVRAVGTASRALPGRSSLTRLSLNQRTTATGPAGGHRRLRRRRAVLDRGVARAAGRGRDDGGRVGLGLGHRQRSPA